MRDGMLAFDDLRKCHRYSPLTGEDFVWRVWAPVNENPDHSEWQIWYTSQLNVCSYKKIEGVCTSTELNAEGSISADGVSIKNLQVRSNSRADASALVIAE